MNSIDEIAQAIHKTAVEHGFWAKKQRNVGEMLMLVVSECAEALEEDRAGNPLVYFSCLVCGADFVPYDGDGERALLPTHCGKVAKPEGALVELGDAIIRLLDTGFHWSQLCGYQISEVLATKMAFNDQREHMHGKAY